jgi:hypothetical protein
MANRIGVSETILTCGGELDDCARVAWVRSPSNTRRHVTYLQRELFPHYVRLNTYFLGEISLIELDVSRRYQNRD